MRTAFPSPDYYGRSATRPPHRRGFSRRLRRPIRATSLLGRASPVSLPTLQHLRLDLAFLYPTADRCSPRHRRPHHGRAADLVPLRGPWSVRRKTWRSPAWAVPYSGVTTPGRLLYWRETGAAFPEGIGRFLHRGHTEALPGGNPSASGASPVSRVVRGAVSPTGSHSPSTYPVGTVACHSATVLSNIADKVTSLQPVGR